MEAHPVHVYLDYIGEEPVEIIPLRLELDLRGGGVLLLDGGLGLLIGGGRGVVALLELRPFLLLLEDAALLPVVLDDELGSRVGDGELPRGLVDGILSVLHHLDQPKPLLHQTESTLKEILEYCALGLA